MSYLGETIPKLGFGYMRLPRKGDGFDTEQINLMVDEYLAAGFTYFDTAFVYEGSEEAMRESLVKRYPREKYQIASKLNLMFPKTKEDMEQQTATTLSRLGTDYLDFYLIHGLGGPGIAKADDMNAWAYMAELREQGKIKHVGFSFHGTPEELEGILSKHPEAEFVQIQLNYLDYDSKDVQSKKVYEVARKHKTPVIIMEPVKGGLLGSEKSPIAKVLREANPDVSVASWALRFAAAHEGLVTVLSGMTTIEQLRDNIKTFSDFKPLSDAETKTIEKAIEVLNATPSIPCTECRYCVANDNCPKKLPIPGFMHIYSDYLVYQTTSSINHVYGFMSKEAKASDCIQCGACEKQCPQHIGIIDYVAKLSALMDK
jgi:predicted aldo/keto reductase-like oxidoreductase